MASISRGMAWRKFALLAALALSAFAFLSYRGRVNLEIAQMQIRLRISLDNAESLATQLKVISEHKEKIDELLKSERILCENRLKEAGSLRKEFRKLENEFNQTKVGFTECLKQIETLNTVDSTTNPKLSQNAAATVGAKPAQNSTTVNENLRKELHGIYGGEYTVNARQQIKQQSDFSQQQKQQQQQNTQQNEPSQQPQQQPQLAGQQHPQLHPSRQLEPQLQEQEQQQQPQLEVDAQQQPEKQPLPKQQRQQQQQQPPQLEEPPGEALPHNNNKDNNNNNNNNNKDNNNNNNYVVGNSVHFQRKEPAHKNVEFHRNVASNDEEQPEHPESPSAKKEVETQSEPHPVIPQPKFRGEENDAGDDDTVGAEKKADDKKHNRRALEPKRAKKKRRRKDAREIEDDDDANVVDFRHDDTPDERNMAEYKEMPI